MNTMNTIIAKAGVDDEHMYEQAAEILRSGGLVAFPTETVYGLGGDALNPDASHKIYSAKGRPSDNPLIVHIADTDSVYELAEYVSDDTKKLMEAFWPGPLTIILNKKAVVPHTTTGGLDTVAIRMPSHPVAMKLIKDSGVYIAAPSANLSGRPSPTTAHHVQQDMDGRIDMIIDGGAVGIGIESTIVDMTGDRPTILRPGYITPEMIKNIVGDVTIDPAITGMNNALRPKAPGMKYRHYAPKADLAIVEGPTEEVINAINQFVKEDQANGLQAGIIATEETISRYPCGTVKCIGSREAEETIAHNLYEVLREFDQCQVSKIYSEAFYTPKMGQAIMNRLLKAAGHKIINIRREEQ